MLKFFKFQACPYQPGYDGCLTNHINGHDIKLECLITFGKQWNKEKILDSMTLYSQTWNWRCLQLILFTPFQLWCQIKFLETKWAFIYTSSGMRMNVRAKSQTIGWMPGQKTSVVRVRLLNLKKPTCILGSHHLCWLVIILDRSLAGVCMGN